MNAVTVLFRSPLIRSLFLVLTLLGAPAVSSAEVYVSVAIAPPPLPVYVQPVVPAPGYIWTPGYWAYGPEGYYWVPGTWVFAPYVGALWTPGYWSWDGVPTSGIRAIGGRAWASTAASTTASAISASATTVDTGATACSATTAR